MSFKVEKRFLDESILRVSTAKSSRGIGLSEVVTLSFLFNGKGGLFEVFHPPFLEAKQNEE